MFSFMEGEEKNIKQSFSLFFFQLVSPSGKWATGHFFSASLFISDGLCHLRVPLALFMSVK